MFNTDWDVDKYRNDYESDEHWGLRREFMVAHKNKFPEFRLVCLTQVFFNMEFLGCKYPEETMTLVTQLADEVAKDFRDSRKDKLKRTFVGAQDAAGAKVKGAKPPPGSIEGSNTGQETVQPATKKRPSDTGLETVEPPTKKRYSEPSSGSVQSSQNTNSKYEFEDNIKELGKTFVFMIPTRANSKKEGDVVSIAKFNFDNNSHKTATCMTGNKAEGWTCTVKANPNPGSTKGEMTPIASAFATTQKEAKEKAYHIMIEQMLQHCKTIIEPNYEWFRDGGTPEFIEKRQPCNQSPRSYLILTKKDTGHISPEVAEKLMVNFKESSNEDMFFLDIEFSEKEKNNLMGRSQHHNLGFRHFGNDVMLRDHHICIYKKKTLDEIFAEAKGLNWKHRKYIITRR